VALHALLAALLLVVRAPRPPPEQPPEAAPATVDMEIAPSPAPSAPTERAVTPQSPPAPRVPAPRPPRAANPAPTQPRAEALPAPPAPPSTRGGSAAPAHPDLSIAALAPEARERVGAAADATGVIEAKPRTRPSVDELRATLEHAQDAVANVERGRVDPILYDYLRGARARFESEAHRLAENIPVGPSAAVRGWSRGYLQRVDEAHRAAAASAGPPSEPDLAPPDSHPDLFRAYGESQTQADAGAEERSVEICLEMRAGGAPVPVLQRPSGNAALDRVALDSFEHAVAARPVSDDKRRARACYDITIRAYRMPPLPMVGCSFDLGSGISCVWPFKKIASVHARLRSVDYAPDRAAQASRSLLRRPR
jgi:hypothetical protein